MIPGVILIVLIICVVAGIVLNRRENKRRDIARDVFNMGVEKLEQLRRVEATLEDASPEIRTAACEEIVRAMVDSVILGLRLFMLDEPFKAGVSVRKWIKGIPSCKLSTLEDMRDVIRLSPQVDMWDLAAKQLQAIIDDANEVVSED